MIQTAIVGYGKSAKYFHVPLLKTAPGFKVTSVMQRTKDDSLTDFPDARLVRDMSTLLEDDKLDLVVITSPNAVHFQQTYDALMAGKHVVVEKPFTVTSTEAEQLTDLAKQQNRILTIFQNRRWDGDFYTVKNIIESGRLGNIVEYEAAWNRFRNRLRDDAWKEKELPGSGILYDLSPHLIDQTLLLFGSPTAVFADVRSQRGGDADDRFDLTLYYPGIKVLLRAGMLVPEATARFIIRGTQGTFIKYGLDPQEEALAAGLLPDAPGWGLEPEENWGMLHLENDGNIYVERVKTLPGNYPGFYEELREAIESKGEVPVLPETGTLIIRIIEKAIESNNKREAVKL
ncbi:MAG: oxidoreductase [Balneolaceae bacterium]|nr:MAG: oxidoreductase [Balneolaceae bacterium]